MSHPERNPCITKQLDRKPPVMQQGSSAPHLLPRWGRGEGEEGGGRGRLSGREGRRIVGGGTAGTEVWLTAHQHSHFADTQSCRFMLKNEPFCCLGVLLEFDHVWSNSGSSDAQQSDASKRVPSKSMLFSITNLVNLFPRWISSRSLLKSSRDDEAHWVRLLNVRLALCSLDPPSITNNILIFSFCINNKVELITFRALEAKGLELLIIQCSLSVVLLPGGMWLSHYQVFLKRTCNCSIALFASIVLPRVLATPGPPGIV